MRRAGFTLIELLLVLAILAMMVALVAPALARSSRQRILEQEALRLLALTEYGRDEAASQGVAMAMYADPSTQIYGLEPATEASGVEVHKEYTLNPDLHFEPMQAMTQKKNGRVIIFTPDGTTDLSSVTEFGITDRGGSTLRVVKQSSGWGYEIAKEGVK